MPFTAFPCAFHCLSFHSLSLCFHSLSLCLKRCSQQGELSICLEATDKIDNDHPVVISGLPFSAFHCPLTALHRGFAAVLLSFKGARRERVIRPCAPKRWHVGRLDRVEHLFGAGATEFIEGAREIDIDAVADNGITIAVAM